MVTRASAIAPGHKNTRARHGHARRPSRVSLLADATWSLLSSRKQPASVPRRGVAAERLSVENLLSCSTVMSHRTRGQAKYKLNVSQVRRRSPIVARILGFEPRDQEIVDRVFSVNIRAFKRDLFPSPRDIVDSQNAAFQETVLREDKSTPRETIEISSRQASVEIRDSRLSSR
jgi:hypothetical protein